MVGLVLGPHHMEFYTYGRWPGGKALKEGHGCFRSHQRCLESLHRYLRVMKLVLKL